MHESMGAYSQWAANRFVRAAMWCTIVGAVAISGCTMPLAGSCGLCGSDGSQRLRMKQCSRLQDGEPVLERQLLYGRLLRLEAPTGWPVGLRQHQRHIVPGPQESLERYRSERRRSREDELQGITVRAAGIRAPSFTVPAFSGGRGCGSAPRPGRAACPSRRRGRSRCCHRRGSRCSA